MTQPSPFNPEAMQAQADAAARMLKVLANPQRLRVLCLLVGHELTVGRINAHLPDLSQSALSQHLARLREEGMVETRRQSQQVWYRLVDGPVRLLIGTLYGIYCDAPLAAATGRRRTPAAHAVRRRARKR